MKIWVTGANGLLGFSLQRALKEQNICYVATTRVDVDVCDWDSLTHFYLQQGPFTHLIHLAAYTNVDLAEQEIEEAYRVNAYSPALIGLLATSFGCRAIYLSTDYVFDGMQSHPYCESDALSPQTIYGKTKAKGEEGLLMTCPDACIIRTSWLFGPGGKNFVTTMLSLIKQREVVRVVSDQRGCPTYAPDLADVLIEALNWSGIYHVANRGETTWYDFAQAIYARQMRPLCQTIEPITSSELEGRAPRPLYSVLNTKKAEQRLGRPMRPWTVGLNLLCAAFNDS